MVSADTKLMLMRGNVVLHAVAAALCLGSTTMLPIFRLRIDDLHSSITQSLWTTSIYTPAVEKHVPAQTFAENCHDLAVAFKFAQVATIIGIVAFTAATLFSIFHLAPTFTRSRHRVRGVCGAPICALLLLGILSTGVSCYIAHSMYEKDWCAAPAATLATAEPLVQSTQLSSTNVPSVVLHLPGKELRDVSILRHSAVTESAVRRTSVAPLSIDTGAAPAYHLGAGGCNPFDGCVSSYRDMGFEGAAGWQTMWSALILSVVGLFAEAIVIATASSHIAEVGVGEATAALLQGEDERLL
ncbi:Amastin surface glycoprotein [Novymonas esmeraldas]|uniref:Amastin surface glycoprotein n=1 Tax=Novymonas esmeraldas TaxID=1808958 RepID=A0AAW0F6L2_9TRYP